MSKKILLVDDDPICLEILGQLLDMYQIKTAKNGSKAIELLESETFDLVITDLIMPYVDGIDVVQKAPKGRVIICTGRSPLPLELKGVPLIRKPFDYDSILTKVASLMDKKTKS